MIRYLHLAFMAVALFSSVARAQLDYHDNSNRFKTPNTAGLLSAQVNVKTPWFPDPNGSQTIYNQADAVYNSLLAAPGALGHHVLVGHSMGGLTSRSSYLRHPQPGVFSAIITVGTPHQGAPIADNALVLAGFLVDQVTDFFQSLINIQNRATPGNILSQAIVNLIQSWVRDVFSDRVLAFLVQEFGLKDDAMRDIRTSSSSIASLNSSFDALPHANVYGTIGRRNAVFRVITSFFYNDGSFDSWMHTKNKIKSAVKACRQIGWNMIIRTHVGRICNQVDNGIGSIDDRWAFFTMGSAEKRDPNATFDGLVPTSHTRYPGTSLADPSINFKAITSNHMNLQYSPPGIGQIALAGRQVGMDPPPPPPPPPGTIGSVSISGPSQVEAGCSVAWAANIYGGVPPYTSVWTVEGTSYETESFVYTAYSNFVIQLTVTDSQGSTGSAAQGITVISGNCT
jgi:pimeloyl-ACP methyl ester carboxylesterase